MVLPVNPIAGIFIIILGLLFITLFIAWCCKQCSQSKQTIVPLISPEDTIYSRRCMTAIDVQTGLPVVIQTVGRNSRNLVRVTSVSSDGRYSINPGCYSTTYGSIERSMPNQDHIVARSPPPPYSEACNQYIV